MSAAGSQALWFVSRASGLALLTGFSATVVLGVAARPGSAPRRWSRLTLGELHRTLALFSVAFLGLHVATAISDPYVTIGWQCGPCRFGLDAIAGQVERLADPGGIDPSQLRRWLGQVDGRGGCAHPSGVVRLISSSLRTFDVELRQHAQGRCRGMASILPVPPGGHR